MCRCPNVVSVYIYVNMKCVFHIVLLFNITNVVDTVLKACFSNFYTDNMTDICSHLCLNEGRLNGDLLIIIFFP